MILTSLLTSSLELSAPYTDPKLINPFDLIVTRKHIWVTIRDNSLVTKYDKTGKLIMSIDIPNPTGITKAISKKCSSIYVASENGNVYTINNNIPTIYITTNSAITGITWHKYNLYLAKYDVGLVQIYHNQAPTWTIMDMPLSQLGYKPYGVREINNKIYITYTNKIIGIGNGYVDSYDPKCKTLERIINRQTLNIPYSIVARNYECKSHEEYDRDIELMIGNYGNGTISIFTDSGRYINQLSNKDGGIITNDGIMGMYLWEDTLYYVAANDGGKIGSLGRIKLY